jgi:hypothetical protein
LLEGDGYAIWSKRLEQGQFNLPKNVAEKTTINIRDLHILIDGIKPLVSLKDTGKIKLKKLKKMTQKGVFQATGLHS